MAIGKRTVHRLRPADMVVEDHDGRPVLLTEVRSTGTDPHKAASQLTEYLQGLGLPIPYAMMVDPEHIQVFVWDGDHLTGPVLSIEAAPILRYYSGYYEEFLARGIRKGFLLTLVRAWLRDLDYQWKTKSAKVPGSDGLAEIGLLPLLKDSTIREEVRTRGHPVP
jgi:hypothetical protein